MKTIAVIQARMGSTRFPGKVLIPLYNGKCSIEIIAEKLKQVKGIDEIVIATSENPIDDKIIQFCKSKGYKTFRGSEDNVLERVVKAIKHYENILNIVDGEIVGDEYYDLTVELTADCPFFDPSLAEKAIAMLDTIIDLDYVSNTITRSWFDGADVQVYRTNIIKKISEGLADEAITEHVGWNILNLADNYSIVNFPASKRYFRPNLRLTLDYPEDGQVISHIMQIAGSENVSIPEIYRIVDANPWLLDINGQRTSKVPGVIE
jgi:spore coat polysaccharide biosynthesis protein SpsF